MLLKWNASAKYYVYPAHRTNCSIWNELHLPANWLYNFVRRQKLKYFGHVTRHDDLEKTIMQGTVAGKRSRGKPRQRWEKDITDTFGTMAAASRVAEDRHQFRRDIWAATSWRGYASRRRHERSVPHLWCHHECHRVPHLKMSCMYYNFDVLWFVCCIACLDYHMAIRYARTNLYILNSLLIVLASNELQPHWCNQLEQSMAKHQHNIIGRPLMSKVSISPQNYRFHDHTHNI